MSMRPRNAKCKYYFPDTRGTKTDRELRYAGDIFWLIIPPAGHDTVIAGQGRPSIDIYTPARARPLPDHI